MTSYGQDDRMTALTTSPPRMLLSSAPLKLTAEEPALRTVQLSRWTSDVLVATTALPRHASMVTPMNRTCETCCISSMPSSSLRPEPQMSKVEQR